MRTLTEVTDAQLEHIRLPFALTGRGDFFLLRANGDSMINAGIYSGDLVLIRKQETAHEGQIVAFLYQGSTRKTERACKTYSDLRRSITAASRGEYVPSSRL